MGSSKRVLFSVLLAVVLGVVPAFADEVQFAEEELPREAVMPRLDTPKAVINRKLSYVKRWSADLTFGWLLDEPFYNNLFTGAQVAYNWSEASGLGLKLISFGSGLSDYSKQFANAAAAPNFERSKGPSSGYIAFYERRMMYGKLSVSKNHVIPAFLNWNIEGGMLSYGKKQLPLLGASLGNRFFFTPSMGATLGVHAYLRQLVDPLSANLSTSSGPVTTESDFKVSTKLSTALDLSFTFLF